MADQDPATAHPQPPQMEVPSLRVPDVQLLVQDLAQSRRDIFEERRNSANRIAEERERSRWEAERLRSEFGAHIKSLERENEALVRAVGRVQAEVDHLREENAILRVSKGNGHLEEKPQPTPAPEKLPPPALQPSGVRAGKQLEVQLVMPSSPMGGKPAAMPMPPQILPVAPPQSFRQG
jgi:hypothetical protein